MKVNQDIMDLICLLEYRIGDSCSNGDSYNGWTNDWGADFRYPVTVDGRGKYRNTIESLGLEPEDLGDIYYKFGANELHVGFGIKHLLEELEERYGLDFAKLEAEYKAKQKSHRR